MIAWFAYAALSFFMSLGISRFLTTERDSDGEICFVFLVWLVLWPGFFVLVPLFWLGEKSGKLVRKLIGR